MIDERIVSTDYSPVRGFHTIEEAISAVGIRYILGEELGPGQEIVRVSWSDSAAYSVFRNSRHLRICIDGRKCAASVESTRVGDACPFSSQLGLHFPRAGYLAWERGPLLQNLVGKRLLRVLANEPNLFVYSEAEDVLMFSVLWDVDHEQALLFWNIAE